MSKKAKFNVSDKKLKSFPTSIILILSKCISLLNLTHVFFSKWKLSVVEHYVKQSSISEQLIRKRWENGQKFTDD